MNAQEFYRQKTKHNLKKNCGVRLTGEELFDLMIEFASLSQSQKDSIITKQTEIIKKQGEVIKSIHNEDGVYLIDTLKEIGELEYELKFLQQI